MKRPLSARVRALVARARSGVVLALVTVGLGVWAGVGYSFKPEAPRREREFDKGPVDRVGRSQSGTSPGGTSRALEAGAPTCLQVRLSDYNLFLLEDYSQGTDVQGKVAAGGNVTLENFSMGAGLPEGAPPQALVAGGNLSLSHGGVHGDAWYGGSYSADSSVIFSRGTASMGTPIDFAARGAELRSLSSSLAGLAATGTVTREPWGGIMMSGTAPEVNVFEVSASTFNGAVLWSIDAPAGSFVVVNIRGASASFSGFGIQLSGGITQNAVLYNFVEATALQAQGFGFWGTVLAPSAEIHFSDGSFEGGIYARSLTGNASGRIHPLVERDLCGTTEPSNSPPIVSITSPSSGASFTAPATMDVVASASDSDGTLSKVEFFRNGVLAGAVTSAPYTVTLTQVPAGTHSLTAKATDDHGASTTSAVVVVSVGVQEQALTITSPINGASIDSDRVLVTGHIAARPPNSGVTVNGVVASVNAAGDFFASVPLVAGGNTLSAMMTPLEGPPLTESVTIVATGQPSPFTVSAAPTVGLAPHAVTFTIANRTQQPASYTFEGSGPSSLPAGSSSTISATYAAGVFTPTILVRDSEANLFSHTLVIEARDAEQMDQHFSAIWNGMNAALLAGDKDRALTYLNEASKRKYGPVFDALLPLMPEIIASYSPLARGSISSGIVEYAIRRSDNGTHRIYLISFLQGFDGVWRIDEM